MQIGAARTDLASISALSGTRSASNSLPVAETVQVETPSNPAPPTSASTPLDMDAFFAAWGTDDATWDVDGSGSVDGTDLGLILTAQTQAATGDSDLESLLGAWGTADSDWDLNGDGIVDGIDLGIHLNGGAIEDGASDAAEAMSLEGFQSVWGTNDSTYDLNGDGVVNGVDLGEFLAQNLGDTAGVDGSPITDTVSAWGTDNPDHDHNGDGTVDGADLGNDLANWGGDGESQAREINVGDTRLDEIARRLATTAFRALDGAGTGSIASNAAGAPLNWFDADGDGNVTQQELASAIRDRLDQLVGADGSVDVAAIRGFTGKWMERFGEGGLVADPIRHANHRHGFERVRTHAAPIADTRSTDAASNKVGRVLSSLGRSSLPPNLSDLLGRI